MKNDVFSTYHPAITFLFFIAAIVFGMCYTHPVFLAISCILSAAYLITIRRGKSIKVLIGLAIVFVIIAVVNPLFNVNGEHVLFTWLGGRPYSMESLCYGMAIGAMFVTILLWFACYNVVMTSDKFLYLFGKMIPSISLVLTMILRLFPSFQKKAAQIAGARKCIGKGGGTSRSEQISNGMAVTSSLTSWALEGGIITADSMQSRGFGSGSRTSFSIYRMDGRSIALLAVMIVLIIAILVCGIKGGMKIVFLPVIEMAGTDNPFMLTGMIAYIVFLAVPTVLNIVEAIKWHSLRSGI